MAVAGSPSGAEALREIRTFMEVFRYLVDVRSWPLEADHIEEDDLDAVTYDWDARDLGIPADGLRDLLELRQMRPLTARQPWGVFFLEFGGERLPKVQVRRLLRALVAKKRTAGALSRPTWRLDDLLFIVFTGSGTSKEVHFVAFRGDDPQSAELRELSWQPAQETRLVLQLLAEEVLPCLDWPENEGDIDSWRSRWRSGLTPGRSGDQRLGPSRRSHGQDCRRSAGPDPRGTDRGEGFRTILDANGRDPHAAC